MAFINILIKYYPSFIAALIETIKLSIISLIAATILGTIFGLFKITKNVVLKGIANIYIEIIRGTPLMVQAFIIYYGFAQLLRPIGFTWASIGGAFTAGAIAMSLNAGAYMAEIIRSGIEAVDQGQMEAARSLGLSYSKAMRKVIFPQALRIMLPSIINQFIISLKDTSILSVIGIRELTMNGKIIAANSASLVMAIWLVVAFFYFIVCLFLSCAAKIAERRLNYGK
ncbi:amino acid ABC transporter permease [Fusobacterium sp.]|uniref:amino acid ABC transporter permease n=1 Tax=Fusobacterium sp. TaxID=68766 RepID=UPI0028FDE947|nr:amino acid ABC transporter permease [Fusobacterium sp.]MDU1912415.1 amino acid ABC transporter permease [Fusobacterium sp.]